MILLRFITFSYHGALQYYTIEPIHDIADSQLDSSKLRRLLHQFKVRKNEEANFVRIAVSTLFSILPAFSFARSCRHRAHYLLQPPSESFLAFRAELLLASQDALVFKLVYVYLCFDKFRK